MSTSSSGFVQTADPWGRPLALRLDDIALIEGAIDGHDKSGDLWAQPPPAPYRRLTLTSGTRVYLNANDAEDVLTLLGL